MALAITTYKYKDQDVILVNNQLRSAANPAVLVADARNLKSGELTLGGKPVELPNRTVDDDHVMTQQNVHDDIYA